MLFVGGGEEFLIILDQSDLKRATDLAERCRISISHIEHALVKKITASIGVAQLKNKEELESFISRADKALYQAKKNGRNIVKISD
jgi:diguanylate cyclase (GGDEF)-like protein